MKKKQISGAATVLADYLSGFSPVDRLAEGVHLKTTDEIISDLASLVVLEVNEVADALAAQKWLAERVAAQKAYVEASQQYYDLAVARYQEGIDSFLTQLDAQRQLFAARQAYVNLRLAQQSNQVNLFKALGGGWKE